MPVMLPAAIVQPPVLDMRMRRGGGVRPEARQIMDAVKAAYSRMRLTALAATVEIDVRVTGPVEGWAPTHFRADLLLQRPDRCRFRYLDGANHRTAVPLRRPPNSPTKAAPDGASLKDAVPPSKTAVPVPTVPPPDGPSTPEPRPDSWWRTAPPCAYVLADGTLYSLLDPEGMHYQKNTVGTGPAAWWTCGWHPG